MLFFDSDCIQHNVHVFVCELAEQHRLSEESPDSFLGLLVLGDDLGHEVLLDVEDSIDLSTDALTTHFFNSFLLFEFLLELPL